MLSAAVKFVSQDAEESACEENLLSPQGPRLDGAKCSSTGKQESCWRWKPGVWDLRH